MISLSIFVKIVLVTVLEGINKHILSLCLFMFIIVLCVVVALSYYEAVSTCCTFTFWNENLSWKRCQGVFLFVHKIPTKFCFWKWDQKSRRVNTNRNAEFGNLTFKWDRITDNEVEGSNVVLLNVNVLLYADDISNVRSRLQTIG